MATLQVRSIEDQLYEALCRRASQENRSISQEVIAILKEYLSQPLSQRNATESFLELCGTLKDSRSAEEISGEIRKSRRSGKRFKDVL